MPEENKPKRKNYVSEAVKRKRAAKKNRSRHMKAYNEERKKIRASKDDPDYKNKVVYVRVNQEKYDAYMDAAHNRHCTTMSEFIRRLLDDETSGRNRSGYVTLVQKRWLSYFRNTPEDNLEDLEAYAILADMELSDLLIEFDRLLDSELLVIEDKKLVWKGEDAQKGILHSDE